MMLCVKFVSYSILVNRESKGFGLFVWGIYLDDSLLPFFNFYCVMKFSLVFISKTDRDGSIRGFIRGFCL